MASGGDVLRVHTNLVQTSCYNGSPACLMAKEQNGTLLQ